jgi:large subunit ribosomal protein L21e
MILYERFDASCSNCEASSPMRKGPKKATTRQKYLRTKMEVGIIMPKSRGYRRKTRMLFRGKPASPLGALLRHYEVGDRVVIDIDSRQTKGMPHRRFQGSVGKVSEVGRRSITVMVPVGDKTKQVISRLEHLKPLRTSTAS